MKIAIITRPEFKSPRILADSLKVQLEKVGVKATIYYSIDVLTRLSNYRSSRNNIKFHFWLKRKLFNYFTDKKFLSKLKSFDAIVISECSPNGFWKDHYQVEKLRLIIKRPILFYEVYYLGNTPTQVGKLRKAGDALIDRYDWHLSVSDVTEIRSKVSSPWSCIGIDLSNSKLKPAIKKEFIALVDFQQEGYDKIQEEQLQTLKELNINTIILKGNYSLDEIREIYSRVSIYFIQSPEAFGLPIAECLACGVQIFTPSSAWPMSWRLDENPKVREEGILPDVFTIYEDRDDLSSKLFEIRNKYNLQETPFHIFDSFIKHYPHFYYGDKNQLENVINRIKDNKFE